MLEQKFRFFLKLCYQGYKLLRQVIIFFSSQLTMPTAIIATTLSSTIGANTPAPSSCVIMRRLKYPRPACAPSHSPIAAPMIDIGIAIFMAEKKYGSAAVTPASLVKNQLGLPTPKIQDRPEEEDEGFARPKGPL